MRAGNVAGAGSSEGQKAPARASRNEVIHFVYDVRLAGRIVGLEQRHTARVGAGMIASQSDKNSL